MNILGKMHTDYQFFVAFEEPFVDTSFNIPQKKLLGRLYNLPEIGCNIHKFIYSIVNSDNWEPTSSIFHRHHSSILPKN